MMFFTERNTRLFAYCCPISVQIIDSCSHLLYTEASKHYFSALSVFLGLLPPDSKRYCSSSPIENIDRIWNYPQMRQDYFSPDGTRPGWSHDGLSSAKSQQAVKRRWVWRICSSKADMANVPRTGPKMGRDKQKVLQLILHRVLHRFDLSCIIHVSTQAFDTKPRNDLI
jgi:hypothetical protein